MHRHRALTLLLGFAMAVGVGGFSATLTVNDSPERWFPQSTLHAWERFQEHYEYGDTLVVGIQFHRPVRDADLPFLKDVRQRMLDIQGVETVTDTSLVAEKIEHAPLTEILADPVPGEDDPYSLYRGIFFDDPAIWKDTEHADDPGRTLLYIILLNDELDLSLTAEQQADQLNARRRHVTDEMELLTAKWDRARDDMTFHSGGSIVVQHELERIARNLVLTLVPLSLVLALIALGLGFRSWWAVAVAIVGGGWAVAVMLGCVALLGWSLNVVTVAGPTLMTVIIVATTVHVAHYYSVTSHQHNVSPSKHEHDDAGPACDSTVSAKLTSEKRDHFVHWVAVPCLGAALTTGFGFLMLAFNELQPARELGIELFIGSVLAFVGAYLAWIWFAPFPAGRGKYLSANHLESAEQTLVKKPVVMAFLLLLALLGLAYSATRVRIDADPFSFFRPDSGPGKSLAHFTERKFGFYVLDVVCVPRLDLFLTKEVLYRLSYMSVNQ